MILSPQTASSSLHGATSLTDAADSNEADQNEIPFLGKRPAFDLANELYVENDDVTAFGFNPVADKIDPVVNLHATVEFATTALPGQDGINTHAATANDGDFLSKEFLKRQRNLAGLILDSPRAAATKSSATDAHADPSQISFADDADTTLEILDSQPRENRQGQSSNGNISVLQLTRSQQNIDETASNAASAALAETEPHSEIIQPAQSVTADLRTFPTSLIQRTALSSTLVAQTIAVASVTTNNADGSIELTLDPPELGKVRISFTDDGQGVVTALVTGERAETQTMLRQHSHILYDLLRDQGVGEAEISFSEWANESSSDQKENTRQAELVELGEPAPSMPAPQSRHPDIRIHTGLDIRI